VRNSTITLALYTRAFIYIHISCLLSLHGIGIIHCHRSQCQQETKTILPRHAMFGRTMHASSASGKASWIHQLTYCSSSMLSLTASRLTIMHCIVSTQDGMTHRKAVILLTLSTRRTKAHPVAYLCVNTTKPQPQINFSIQTIATSADLPCIGQAHPAVHLHRICIGSSVL
jgi:hypothetical protein